MCFGPPEEPTVLLSSLFEALPVGVLAEDSSRNVLAANQRLFALFTPLETRTQLPETDCETIVREISEVFVDAGGFVERTDEIVANETPVDGEQWALKDGRTFERTYRPIELPDGDGHLWMYRDVTSSTDLVNELTEHEERLSLALSAGDMGMWELDLRSKESPVRSSQHDRIFGYEEPLEEWGFERFLEHVHPDDREQVHQTFDNAFESGTWVFECRIIRTDGETRWIKAEGEFHFDANGEPDRSVGVIEDITERKADQIELERVNERLEQFSSMVTHDIRNPLSVALGRMELYHETGEQSHLTAVETSLTRIQEIVTDLSTLARFGTVDPEAEPISLAAVAKDAWEMVDSRSATLTTEACSFVGDRSHLQGLFENLFRNAIGHGGNDVIIRVGPLSDGFYVEDSGSGIPPENRERVFEHGYTTGYGGSGVGLTIVKQIATLHNLEVSVSESSEGGARFEFRASTDRE